MPKRSGTLPTKTTLPVHHLTMHDEGLLRGFRLALEGGWRPRLQSEQSVRVYLFCATRFARFLAGNGMPGLTVCTREHVLEYMAVLRKERAPATAQLYLKVVKLLMLWLREEGERTDDPTERVKGPPDDKRLREPYSAADVKKIFGAQDGRTLIGARNLALFAVLLDTGLRREEVSRLVIEDIDFRHGEVRVLGKGAKERKVRVGPSALRYLDAYLRARGRRKVDTPDLWLSQRGARLTKEAISRLHKDMGKRLGLHMTPHRWRHSFAQMALDNGMDRESVRVLLGHASDATLRIYTRATDARRALDQHKRFSPVDRLMRDR